MRNLIIFGDTPFAERIAMYIEIEKPDKILAFTQEGRFISRSSIKGFPVIPFEDLSDFYKKDSFELILGIGYTEMNNLREKVFNLCASQGYSIGNYISSNAVVYASEMGEGTVILPGSVVGPGCRFGKGNFAASSCVFSHDDAVGDFNFFSTNVVMGGHAKIRSHCFCGLNSTIRSSINVDDYTLLGSCTNLTKSTHKSGLVYVGNPAKPINGKVSTETKI